MEIFQLGNILLTEIVYTISGSIEYHEYEEKSTF